MRVALFTDFYKPHRGGVESAVAVHKAALEARGHQVTIVCPEYPDYDEVESELVRLKPSLGIIIDGNPQILPSRRNQSTMLRQQFDMVHVHSLGGVGLLGVWYGRRTGVPVIMTFHYNPALIADVAKPSKVGRYLTAWFLCAWHRGLARRLKLTAPVDLQNHDPRPKAWDWRWTLLAAPYANALVVPSRHFMHELRQRWPQGAYHLVPNAVDVSRYKPQYATTGPIRLLWAARMAAEKRPLEFLEAIRVLFHETRQPFVVDVLGSGPLFAKARAFVADHKLDCVRLHGGVAYAETVAFYQRADVFVLSSHGIDNQPMVLAEAAASGLPVVLSDPQLVGQIAPDGYYLAHSALPEDLAMALTSALRKKSIQNARTIRTFAKQHYDLNILATRLDKLYRECRGD